MNQSPECTCCAGGAVVSKEQAANPPGLERISFRTGTHGQLLSSMLGRLSAPAYPSSHPLLVRTPDDPAIAFLDASAVLFDIVSFHAERIVNEGYLRTATSADSLRLLGRLVGHIPRPGVAAGGYLAYTIDGDTEAHIPFGTRAQSVPGPGGEPQYFETEEPLTARAAWSDLQVRLRRPYQAKATAGEPLASMVYFAGANLRIQVGDRLVFVPRVSVSGPYLDVVEAASVDHEHDVTAVTLQIPDLAVHAARLQGILTDAKATDMYRTRSVIVRRFVDDVLQPVDEFVQRARGDADPKALSADRFGDALADVLRGWKQAMDDTVAYANVHGYLAELGTALGLLQSRVARLEHDVATKVSAARPTLGEALGLAASVRNGAPPPKDPALLGLLSMLAALRKPAARLPRSARRLHREFAQAFGVGSDSGVRLLAALDPRLAQLYAAWSKVDVTQSPTVDDVQVMRIVAAPFGATAPKRVTVNEDGAVSYDEWTLYDLFEATTDVVPYDPANGGGINPEYVLLLDAVYPGVGAGSLVSIERSTKPGDDVTTVVKSVHVVSPAGMGLSGKVTALILDERWIDYPTEEDGHQGNSFPDVRATSVYLGGESLELAMEPIPDDVEGEWIELDDLYDGLEPGRWLIVTGERTDIEGAAGVVATELTMIAAVNQGVDPTKPGDRVHTLLRLAAPLSYSYKRDTAHVYGNVVRATQGARRDEVLGSGDASKPNQRFPLSGIPLTWLAADTPLGARNTLDVRVDGVLWHEVDSLAGQPPEARVYTTAVGKAGKTIVTFGDGRHGARLPTGAENVRATYRAGMGRSGNVGANKITTPVTRPLGVTGVTNPLPADGGADADGPGETRRQIPLAVLALDRLVGVPDYENFARARAGIGKAAAQQLYDGHRQLVYVTVAGADDIPLSEDSDIVTMLATSLATFGDPQVLVAVAVRDPVLLVISAGLRIVADYSYELVEPLVRAKLLDGLGFDKRELGAPAFLSEAVALAQSVPGVDYVDVDVFAGVPGSITPAEISDLAEVLVEPQTVVPAKWARFDTTVYKVAPPYEGIRAVAAKNGITESELRRLNPGLGEYPVLSAGQELIVFRGIRPTQLVMLSPTLPETLILKEVQ